MVKYTTLEIWYPWIFNFIQNFKQFVETMEKLKNFLKKKKETSLENVEFFESTDDKKFMQENILFANEKNEDLENKASKTLSATTPTRAQQYRKASKSFTSTDFSFLVEQLENNEQKEREKTERKKEKISNIKEEDISNNYKRKNNTNNINNNNNNKNTNKTTKENYKNTPKKLEQLSVDFRQSKTQLSIDAYQITELASRNLQNRLIGKVNFIGAIGVHSYESFQQQIAQEGDLYFSNLQSSSSSSSSSPLRIISRPESSYNYFDTNNINDNINNNDNINGRSKLSQSLPSVTLIKNLNNLNNNLENNNNNNNNNKEVNSENDNNNKINNEEKINKEREEEGEEEEDDDDDDLTIDNENEEKECKYNEDNNNDYDNNEEENENNIDIINERRNKKIAINLSGVGNNNAIDPLKLSPLKFAIQNLTSPRPLSPIVRSSFQFCFNYLILLFIFIMNYY